MRADNISDLPFPVGTSLTLDQVPVLKQYNRHDVTMTKRFYHESLDMIRFREELTARYQRGLHEPQRHQDRQGLLRHGT